MINVKNKTICALPLTDCGISKEYIKKDGKVTHNGTDWGWYNKPNAEVYPIQDGIVREVGYGDEASSIGYYVTVEHQYSDGTHRFTGYIHLKDKAKVKVGQEVKAGKTILGYRGGSPYKANGTACFATHLHLYTTKCTTKAYSWSTMKSLSIDPFSELGFYRLKDISYACAKQDGHNFGTAPIYEDAYNYESEYEGEIKALQEQLEEMTTKLTKAESARKTAENKLQRMLVIINESNT